MKWICEEDNRTGMKKYVSVYGGEVGSADMYPCMYCEIAREKRYDIEGKPHTKYIVRGTIRHMEPNGSVAKVELKKETTTVKEAKGYVQREFDKIAK